jgi:Arc/MetJ-type ribon-helix-helix transcriptional regulator
MQAIQTLRVYANLPQIYSASVKRGERSTSPLPSIPGKTYQGTLVRTADAIDPVSRTLLVEIDVDNRAGELLPGSLAQVHFKTPPAGPPSLCPPRAHLPQRGPARGHVVNGNVAHLVPVVIGEDDGATVQIVTGLSAATAVIQDPPDSLIEGEKVYVESPASKAKREASSDAALPLCLAEPRAFLANPGSRLALLRRAVANAPGLRRCPAERFSEGIDRGAFAAGHAGLCSPHRLQARWPQLQSPPIHRPLPTKETGASTVHRPSAQSGRRRLAARQPLRRHAEAASGGRSTRTRSSTSLKSASPPTTRDCARRWRPIWPRATRSSGARHSLSHALRRAVRHARQEFGEQAAGHPEHDPNYNDLIIAGQAAGSRTSGAASAAPSRPPTRTRRPAPRTWPT